MESSLALNKLLGRTDIWRGRYIERTGETRDTGFAALNQVLTGGGWPLQGLTELAYPRLGSGEWQLLSATLKNFTDHPGYLVLINPPVLLCATALAQMGVPLDRVLVIRPRSREELLASVLETLRADCAQMLLFWEASYHMSYAEKRKVQLAAKAGSFCISMQVGVTPAPSSPAVLRLQLQAGVAGLQLSVVRQRGGLQGQEVELPWPEGWTLRPFDATATVPVKPQTGQVVAFQTRV